MSYRQAPAISLVTLGCAKNEVDSRKMGDRLLAAGYRLVDDPSTADAIIVNTCSFIQPATEESLDAFFSLAGMENVECGDVPIIVAGCMPARYGDDLASELQEARAFVPCAREGDIVSVVSSFFEGRLPEALAAHETLSAEGGAGADQASGEISAYVKISEGCDRFCSYCTIPFIRGRYRSFALDDILADVRDRVEAGAREIVLIAQDTGRWGQDFQQPSSLSELMDTLATRFPDTWFRVMYLQPEGVTDALLGVMALHENICSYLDIPLQHVAAPILRAMNRRGSSESFLALIKRIRKAVPQVVLRTTLIAGFPGETEQQLDELVSFLQEARIDYAGVFPYSREEGTAAADLAGQIPEQVKLERAQLLRDTADAISGPLIHERVGRHMRVLVLGHEEDDQLYGRAQCQAPDVDGVVFISEGTPGQMVDVEIRDTLMYEMEGE